MRFFLKKIARRRTLERIVRERLTEPIHLNAISVLVAVFGSYLRKIDFDLILRPHNAFSIVEAARGARSQGKSAVTIAEFGVASGAGLMNMARIAERVSRMTQARIRIVGFDTGSGMPPARDYRDHPELYWQGNYPMDEARLRAALPSNTELLLGDLATTVPAFLQTLSAEAPLGYIVLDLDYYWSTLEALTAFEAAPDRYLPVTRVFVDDVDLYSHNAWCGARGAIADFNTRHALRKLERDEFLVHDRIFKHPQWISQMWKMHVLDHPARNTLSPKPFVLSMQNPYL